MKYLSEKTNKAYDSVEELEKAELALEEKNKKALIVKEERAKAAKEVEEAYNKANEAYKEAKAKLDEFLKKYGSYHTTVNNSNSLFDWFFDSWIF